MLFFLQLHGQAAQMHDHVLSAGIEVTVIETERESHAREVVELLQTCDLERLDGIVAVCTACLLADQMCQFMYWLCLARSIDFLRQQSSRSCART